MSFQVTGAELSPMGNLPTPLHIHVVSNTPGRLRFRVTHEYRQPEMLAAIANALKSFSSQIQRVRTTTLTGSVTVNYNGDADSFNHALTSLQQFGVVVVDPLTGESKASAQVSSTMARANQWVQANTGGVVDLRFLVPLMFGILALRQVLAQSPGLNTAPWYVMAWYAFDSFIKLNSEGGAVQNLPNNGRLSAGKG